MNIDRRASKYNLSKRKIIDDQNIESLYDYDSIFSAESLSDYSLLETRETTSHLKWCPLDTLNGSLHSTHTTVKMKSPSGFGSASKRRHFSLEEVPTLKFIEKSDKLPLETSPINFPKLLKNFFGCFSCRN